METWTFEVARVLVRRGHTVVVFTPKLRGHTDDEVMDGIQVRRFGPPSLASTLSELRPYPYLARLPMFSIWLPWRVIRERQFDAVIVTYVSLGFVGLILRLLRIPTWVVIHGFYERSAAFEAHGALRGMMRVLVQDLILKIPVYGYMVVGKEVGAALLRRGVDKNKLNLVQGGVGFNEIDSVHAEKSSAPQVCFVSRMIPERRLDELLRAFALVLKRVPAARLVAVGDGPMRKQSEELARSLKIDSNVQFTGTLYGQAKVETIKRSHVLAHPSIREGMSLTIFEALACSTPVVAYDIPEIREQLGMTRGGFLVSPHDIEGFAHALLNLLDDPSMRAKIGSKGRMAVRDFDWSSVGEQVERLTKL
jgi:glycosyltransferase involved in cell wall biosynthesis